LDATHEEKIKLYQDAKVVLFPSRFNEPYGLIVPETNSCGSFVIGLNDGAIPETIEEGVSGYVVSKSTGQHSIEDDVDAMVEGVKRLEREGFSPERCRESALRFSIDKCASRYEELFDMIIKGMEW
jgi:glycosyltransferase involved in cell wall biosynthesis